jgi:two-component system, chemotaxis family, CheB/CheR fusion protein
LTTMSEISLARAQILSSVVSDDAYPHALLAQSALVHADIPLLLVDSRLEIRLYTPAAATMLRLADTEKEQPLESIQELVRDPALLADARLVLGGHETIDRVVSMPDNRCYLRRIAAYRTTTHLFDGLIVTFIDITHQERVARQLKAEKQQAELASVVNMRRLSAVCHDLRQPMNTLGLIGGLLAQSFGDPLAQRLAQLLEESLQAMSGMLSSAHYGCRLTAGALRPDVCEFSVGQIFSHLRREFAYHSGATGLTLRVVSSRLPVRSDPALLEQMIRSLLAHMMKTSVGKVLLGCRRTSDSAWVEFWRAGQASEQVTLTDRPTNSVWPNGLELAKKLADLLGCRLRISTDARQPAFVIELPLGGSIRHAEEAEGSTPGNAAAGPSRSKNVGTDEAAPASEATVFVVDDDDDACSMLEQILQRPGLVVHTYRSAEAFLASFTSLNHSCLLIDANLGGMQGIQLMQHLNALGSRPPTIMISGRADVGAAVEAMKAGALDFVEKPINPSELRAAVERALVEARSRHQVQSERQEVLANMSKLTTRQRQVLHLMLEGKSSKTIAAQLLMSQRTVESHRANVMKKMAVKSLPELARMISIAKADGASARTEGLLSGRWPL